MSFSQVVPVDDEGTSDTSGIVPSSKKPILRQHCINKQDTLSRITTTTEGQIESVFEKFDKNNDGSISSMEMALVQKAMSKEIGDKRAHEVVTYADTNNDDILSKSEFLVMMHQFKREKVHVVKDDIRLFRENDALQKKVAVVTGGKCCAGQKQIFAHTLKSIFYQRTEALIVLTSLVTVACLYPLLNTTYTSKVCVCVCVCVCVAHVLELCTFRFLTLSPEHTLAIRTTYKSVEWATCAFGASTG